MCRNGLCFGRLITHILPQIAEVSVHTVTPWETIEDFRAQRPLIKWDWFAATRMDDPRFMYVAPFLLRSRT